MNEYRDQRILVVGLGIEGAAMARFLAGQEARVTVSDAKPAAVLAGRMKELAGVPVEYRLGGTGPELAAGMDAVYLSQSVPVSLPLVQEARRRDVPVGSIVTLAYDIFRGRMAAVTGSSGKTTSTHLISAIFTAAGVEHVFGGNVGRWPLDELAAAPADGWAVLELSHTQLQLASRSPYIACVTNVTPNHLDNFTWEEYVALKRNHVRYQGPDDLAVLNLDNDIARSFRHDTAGEVLFFSMREDLLGDGALLRDEMVIWRRHGQETPVLPAAEIPLRGRHNIENVLAATAVAGAAGLPVEAVAAGVRSFKAVPHRLEPVARVNGATWYNDSIATAPERTLAGMRSFHEPLVLLLGGRDKHLPLEELAGECVQRCRAVVTFGEAGPLFAEAVGAARASERPALEQAQTLAEAVGKAARLSRPGDVVLLSPAGTSFDAYANFERRGEEFRRLVHELAEAVGEGRTGSVNRSA